MKPNNYLFLFAVSIMLFYSCKREITPISGTIVNNVIVLPDSTALSNITYYSDSTGAVNFSNPVNYSVGDIIVAGISNNTPNGFLRRITSISSDNKTVQSTQATIEDALIDGNVEYQKQMTVSSGKKKMGTDKVLDGVELLDNTSAFDFEFLLTDVVLYDADGNNQTTNDQIIANGHINFNSTYDIKLNVKNRKLDYFLFRNTVNEESQIKVDAVASVTINKEITIWSSGYSAVLIGYIGPVPVIVTPKLDVIVSIDGNVSFGASTSVTQNASLTGGISYQNNQWNKLNSFTNSFTYNPPQISSNLSFTSTGSAELSLLLYGVVGPYAEAGAYGKLTASGTPLSWTLYGGLEVIAGAKIEALSKTWVDYNATVISYEKVLAQSGGTGSAPVTNFTANATSIAPGGTVNFTDLSINTPTSWSWSFPGGTPTSFTSQNPTVIYNTVGTYDVLLTAANSYGSDSETKFGYITVTNVGQTGTMTDPRDGQIYATVKIGNQWWFAENLNYGTYITVSDTQTNNGVVEKHCQNISGTEDPTCPMGGLYQWDEAMQYAATCNGTGASPNDRCPTPVQGVCPTGWHIPSHHEWTTLEKNVGSNPSAFPYDNTTTGWLGTDEGGNMKVAPICGTLPCWNSPNIGATNSSGFSAIPAGNSWPGVLLNGVGWNGYWWSTTESSGTYAWYRGLSENFAQVKRDGTDKVYGISCRCVKD